MSVGAIVNGRRGSSAEAGESQAFTTSDATPVDVVLASVPNGGDSVPIMDLYVFATFAGLENPEVESLAWGGLALNDVAGLGGVLVLTNFNVPAAYGSTAIRPTIAIVAAGTEIVARCTGLAATPVSWRVYWRNA